jgi:hypothetical protein
MGVGYSLLDIGYLRVEIGGMIVLHVSGKACPVKKALAYIYN